MIPSGHAALRIQQISHHCMGLVIELENEAEEAAQEVRDFGIADYEAQPVVIESRNPDSIFFEPHRWIEFYSQFL